MTSRYALGRTTYVVIKSGGTNKATNSSEEREKIMIRKIDVTSYPFLPLYIHVFSTAVLAH